MPLDPAKHSDRSLCDLSIQEKQEQYLAVCEAWHNLVTYGREGDSIIIERGKGRIYIKPMRRVSHKHNAE